MRPYIRFQYSCMQSRMTNKISYILHIIIVVVVIIPAMPGGGTVL